MIIHVNDMTYTFKTVLSVHIDISKLYRKHVVCSKVSPGHDLYSPYTYLTRRALEDSPGRDLYASSSVLWH